MKLKTLLATAVAGVMFAGSSVLAGTSVDFVIGQAFESRSHSWCDAEALLLGKFETPIALAI